MAAQILPAELTPEAVTAAARRLLDDPRMAANARHVQAEIATMPGPDDVVATLIDRC